MRTRPQDPLQILSPAGWIAAMVLVLTLSLALVFAAFPLR